MLLKIYMIIITLIAETLADQEKGYTANVGTVLFTAKDIEKKQWTKNDIALLQARRHFENILPPPGYYNNFNEDYIHNLLHYFKRAYANVKREDLDNDTGNILKKALSDALGGHLKVWILPLSKLNFYAGSVSQEHIENLFKFYNELKDYLGTDGDGWRDPDDILMNSFKINVAPRIITSFTRILKDPCDHLAFFEKTSNGLSVPLPHINWDKRLSTMFVPLKNVSLISLNSPNQKNTLINYYDLAKRCIAVSNPVEAEIFEEKFQLWLDSEVIPHLKDNNLYFALNGVLTIANSTRALYNSAMPQYNKKFHSLSGTHLPFNISSKKMMIIFVILLLEIAWCVPALIYLLCTKKKKDYKKVYLFLNPRKKKDKVSFFRKESHNNIKYVGDFSPASDFKDIETQRPSTLLELADANTSFTGQSYFRQEPIVSYSEFEAQCPSSRYTVAVGTGSRSYFSSKNQSTEAIVASTCNASRKSSLKKTLDAQMRTIHTARVLPLSSQEKLRHMEQTDKVFLIREDTGKSSPKKKLHSKESEKKTALPQKRVEHGKVIKSISPTKRVEHSKDTKAVQQKQTEQSKDLKSNKTNETNINDSGNRPHAVKTTPKGETQKQSIPEAMNIKAFGNSLAQNSSEISKATESDVTEVQHSSYRQYADECPCSGCCTTNAKHDIATKLITNITQLPGSKAMVIPEAIPEERQSSNKTTRFQIFKERKLKKGAFKVSDLGKPLFEITIDRPATGIAVDVTKSHKKRSKIPKPRTNVPELVMQQLGSTESVLTANKTEKPKSFIPQLKRKTLDDIILARANCKPDIYRFNKLNDTI